MIRLRSVKYGFLIPITASVFALLMLQVIVQSLANSIPEPNSDFWLPDDAIKVFDSRGRCLACNASSASSLNLDRLPKHVLDAFLSSEDQRFYEHSGVDVFSVARAAFVNLRAGRVVQGGSTITQQVVKSYMLDRRRKLARKVWEALYALAIERKMSKTKIFSLYLQRIEFGQGTVGLAEAAYAYFRKSPYELSLIESALLAGLPKAPTAYNPIRYPSKALARRNVVLKMMVDTGAISSRQFHEFKRRPLQVIGKKGMALRQEVVARDVLLRELAVRAEVNQDLNSNLNIHSTMDLSVIDLASHRLRKIRANTKTAGQALDEVQAAAVLVRLHDGALLGLVGGIGDSGSHFNRTQNMRRHPGSFFLPLLYSLAINSGYPWGQSLYATEKQSMPSQRAVSGTSDEPNLMDGLKEHLAMESTRLGAVMGLGTVRQHCENIGLRCEKQDIRLVAGMSPESPMDLAYAYSCLARGGNCRQFYSLKRVESRGQVIYTHVATETKSSRLRSGVVESVNRVLRKIKRSSKVTSYAGRDGRGHNLWAVSYDRDHLALLWMGSERGRVNLLSQNSRYLQSLENEARFLTQAMSGRLLRISNRK